jgi:hypothetical protein
MAWGSWFYSLGLVLYLILVGLLTLMVGYVLIAEKFCDLCCTLCIMSFKCYWCCNYLSTIFPGAWVMTCLRQVLVRPVPTAKVGLSLGCFSVFCQIGILSMMPFLWQVFVKVTRPFLAVEVVQHHVAFGFGVRRSSVVWFLVSNVVATLPATFDLRLELFLREYLFIF